MAAFLPGADQPAASGDRTGERTSAISVLRDILRLVFVPDELMDINRELADENSRLAVRVVELELENRRLRALMGEVE